MRTGLRSRLTLIVTVGAAITLAVLTLGFNLALRASLDSDAGRLLDARAQAALQSVRAEHGKVSLRRGGVESGPDAQSWVFASGRSLLAPAAPHRVDRLARSIANGSATTAHDDASDTRLLAAPITEDGERVGAVVSAISEEPYERTANKALYASMIFAVVALVLIVIASRFVINRALRPVARMTAEAAEWSEHDLGHRFNAGAPHDELTQLAATFDGMLERLARALRHEQRFSAELSHELRTPLAAIVTEAELALRRERSGGDYRASIERIGRRASQLQDVLETLLIAAREESLQGQAADAATAAERALDGFEALAGERRIDLEARLPAERVEVAAAPGTVERILAPLLENACDYAHSQAALEVLAVNGEVRFVVTDDGPGVDPGEADAIFEPGARGTAGRSRSSKTGTGLGLALSRRLAQAAGGNVRAVSGGFEIRLPRSQVLEADLRG